MPSWINVIDEFMIEWFNKWYTGFFVTAVIFIPLEMSGIPIVALSHPFCGDHILSKARIVQLKLVRINGKIWRRLLGS